MSRYPRYLLNVMDSFVDCAAKALLYIKKNNLKASVMRYHMHTQLKVSDFEMVYLNNN